MYLKGIIFERSLTIRLFEKSQVVEKKMFFYLFVTPILPVSSPLLPVTLTLDCKQYSDMLIFSMFQREQNSTIQKQEHKEKNRNIENLIQIQYIVVQYSDPNSQLFYNFIINIYSFQWKLANKNEKNTKRMHKQDIRWKYVKNWEFRSLLLIYDDVSKTKMTSANIWL